MALSDGNPGAVNVLMMILKEGSAIDPDAADPSLTLLSFDTNEIYGSRIWVLYKNVCDQSLVKTIAALRAVQLGIVSKETLNDAIGDVNGQKHNEEAREFFRNEAQTKVREELSNFGIPTAEADTDAA